MAEAKKTTKKTVKSSELVVEATATEVATGVENLAEEVEVKETKATAKAGKRSAKATREVEAKDAKEARKTEAPNDDKPKEVKNPVRTRTERAGKKYREAVKQIDKDKVYSLGEALELAVKTSTTKFDATVEMHVNLNVDPKQADQNVRDSVILPAGTGKTIRIAVMADDAEAKEAKAAGADVVGAEAVLALLEKEQLDFDVLIATPTQMPKLGKYARLLGPRGMMPNPKSGTVTTDIAKAINDAKAGKVEYRVDQAGIVHLGLGKVGFGVEKLTQNAEAVTTSIKAAKPSSTKGAYIKAAYITTTMGPSIKFDLT